MILSIVILVNIGFSFTLLLSTFYHSTDDSDPSKFSTIKSFIYGQIKPSDTDFKLIIDLLKQDKDIKEKYIMSFDSSYSFNTNSKFIFTGFTEGQENDTAIDFITKKNWSHYELWYSDINSIPRQKDLRSPDYVIYSYSYPLVDPTTTWYVSNQISHVHSLLSNPHDPNLSEFLHPIYYSNSTKGGLVVYKVLDRK
jgi:hypothetical protein